VIEVFYVTESKLAGGIGLHCENLRPLI